MSNQVNNHFNHLVCNYMVFPIYTPIWRVSSLTLKMIDRKTVLPTICPIIIANRIFIYHIFILQRNWFHPSLLRPQNEIKLIRIFGATNVWNKFDILSLSKIICSYEYKFYYVLINNCSLFHLSYYHFPI